MLRYGTAGSAARNGLLLLLMALLFVGCASGVTPRGIPADIYQKGETSPNLFLSTVIVRP